MIDTIFNHRSIRKFKTEPINPDILNIILEAGIRASTTGNMQVYSIIVTTSKELKDKLWECHFKQDMVKTAPVILTFCADFNRFNKWCELREAKPGYNNFLSFMTGAIDALLAAQNIAIAAEAYGLGICYLGTAIYNAKEISEILEIPKNVVPITAIAMGYPSEIPPLTDRLPLEAVVHYEKYYDYDDDKINLLYSQKENLPFYQELVKLNNKKNLAQIFTDNRYKKEDNVLFSKKYLEFIKKQGFMNNE